jgi:hypothetical protein
VLCTTHSDLIIQYASRTVIAENKDGGTNLASKNDPRAALDVLSGAGVARWVHPILFWPLDPIILVEGKFDREFIEEAFRFYRPKRPVRVVDLPGLDDATGGGGVERVLRYIKANANAIRSRRSEAPLIVVLDWDAAKKVDQFKKLVDSPSVYKVLAWRAEAANPKASKSFKGIERFHCYLCREPRQGPVLGRKDDSAIPCVMPHTGASPRPAGTREDPQHLQYTDLLIAKIQECDRISDCVDGGNGMRCRPICQAC